MDSRINNSQLKIDTLISQHKKFWNRELEKPIISRHSIVSKVEKIPVLHEAWKGKNSLILKPEDITPDKYQNPPEVIDLENPHISGPVFNVITPYLRIPWLPCVAGCNIEVSWDSKTVWAHKSMSESWFGEKNVGFKPCRAWLNKLLEFTGYLVENYSSQAIVTLDTICRGVGDLLINLMGESALMEMYDHPDELKQLLSQITDLHIEWAQRQLDLIPKFENGFCNQYGLYAPGTITRFQEDFSCMISDKQYDEFLRPCDEKIVNSFEYQVFHTHSGTPQVAERALRLDGLKAIDVALDPNGPSLESLIPLWNRILDKKCLIIFGSLTQKQLELLVKELSPCGLMFDTLIEEEQRDGSVWFQSVR